jgi:hypothetical protein
VEWPSGRQRWPIRVAIVVQCSAHHDVRLTALRTAGHCCPKVADGFLGAFRQKDVTQVEIDPEIPGVAQLGRAHEGPRFLPFSAVVQDLVGQPPEDQRRLVGSLRGP